MSDSDYYARIAALVQLLHELKAQLRALDMRLSAAEQSLDQRWNSAQTPT